MTKTKQNEVIEIKDEQEVFKMKTMTWEEAVLTSFSDFGGKATNRQIYELIQKYIELSYEHRKLTYGVPNYQHAVRSTLTNLRQKHKLVSLGEGVNCLPSEAQ